eukprot:819934-Pelagomonas_calceolata.AAC.3
MLDAASGGGRCSLVEGFATVTETGVTLRPKTHFCGPSSILFALHGLGYRQRDVAFGEGHCKMALHWLRYRQKGNMYGAAVERYGTAAEECGAAEGYSMLWILVLWRCIHSKSSLLHDVIMLCSSVPPASIRAYGSAQMECWDDCSAQHQSIWLCTNGMLGRLQCSAPEHMALHKWNAGTTAVLSISAFLC